MNYTITPSSIDMRQLLHVCGVPQGFGRGPVLAQPFYWGIGEIELMLSRSIASMAFIQDGEPHGGVMVASYERPLDCQRAFNLLVEGMLLKDFDHSVAGTGEFAIARNRESPYSFGAHTPNVIILVNVPFSTNCNNLDAYSNRLLEDLYTFSLEPSLLEEWIAGSGKVEQSANGDWIEEMVSGISSFVQPHLATLSTKFRQRVRRDDYGNEDYSASIEEVDYFAENVVAKHFHFDNVAKRLIRAALVRMVREFERTRPPGSLAVSIENLDPLAFEQYCADSLRDYGWTARTTKKSGDQGVDVLAACGGIKVVLQCKKLSTPVGNGAVQEAIAGKAFEQADVACVVTNATFTQAAKQLAAMSGVLLLHYRDLPHLGERIGLAGA